MKTRFLTDEDRRDLDGRIDRIGDTLCDISSSLNSKVNKLVTRVNALEEYAPEVYDGSVTVE